MDNSNNKITLKTIFKLIIENKSSFIWGQSIMLLAILISIPIPIILPLMIDEILLQKPAFFVENIDAIFGKTNAFYYISIVAFCVIALRLIYYILSIFITKVFTKISKYVTYKLRLQTLEHLQIVSIKEYESLGSGSILSNLITDINTLDNFIIVSVSKFVSSVLTILVVGIVMMYIDLILGIMILILQPLIMVLSKRMSKAVGKLKKYENESIAKFQEDVGETLELFGQIKASNKEDIFFKNAKMQAKDIQISSNEYGYKSLAYEKLSYTMFLIMFEVLRASGLLLVAYGDLSIGMMFAMFGYIWFIITPVQDILSTQYSYSSAMTSLERINKIFDLKIEKSAEVKLENKGIDIEIKNLYFSYKKDKPILKNISLNIKSGSKVALIGASGSGKTTLAQMISGFYEKDSGEIKYNGIDIEDINKSSLRQEVFLILQAPILFNTSLRFNITMYDESIKDDEIYKALEIAQLTTMIYDMPDKLDTIVGHHGVRLSGGQRQRLSIARMIIADPKIVIFDESTSALDVGIEKSLFEATANFLKDKTVMIIAHRLSTVKNANIIYVLENGNLVQKGTHEQLEQNKGHYVEFLKKQLI